MGSVTNIVNYVEDLKSLIAQIKDDPSYTPKQRQQMVEYLKTEIKALLFDNEEAA